MRMLVSWSLPLTLLAFCASGLAEAREPSPNRAPDARRDAEIAELKLLLYERVDYALRVRRLDSEIKLAEAEVASLKRIVEQYRPFEQLRNSSPLLATRESAKLKLLETELRVKDLKEERILLRRYHGEQRRLLELEAQQARDRIPSIRRSSEPRWLRATSADTR